MTETAKTIAFVAVALVSLVAAWATQPSSADLDVASLVGEDLTKDFTDSTEAKRLRIVDFDEDSATLREFEVAEENGLWTIPSKDGYPADAERQMAEAATSLMDRKILAVASEDAADHEQFGVIDPTSPKLEVGQKGVGRYVRVSDVHDEPLVELVIGQEVKDTTNQQHYARKAGQDIVYVVELDPEPLSTHFEDWIEKDLLKLNPWDLAQVEIKDYSAELQPVMTAQGLAIQVAWDPRSELVLSYDDGGSKWTPKSLKKFNAAAEKQEEFQLADDQELNSEKLNGLKSALDDLKIVDVARKPAGLSADLKAGENFLNSREAISDLRARGFAALPASLGRDQEIISSEGEVICTMQDGVEYVLRFGDLRMSSGSSEKKDDADAGESAAEPKSGGENVQRYLFAMVRFNEDAVKRPELAELPALPEGSDAAPEATDAADAVEPSEEEEEEEEEKQELEAADAETAVAADAESEPAEPAESADDETAEDETAEDDEQSKAIAQVIAERKRIEQENQRKLDEYKERLDKGRQTVKDLNLRFGDWYFVVSNDTFQKIRLSRDDVIKTKDVEVDAGESAAADGESAGASAAGAPGTSVPGLPSIPGAGQ
jgi:hypothetical protein